MKLYATLGRMKPLLQVGMLTNGQVSVLVNTLDLFTP